MIVREERIVKQGSGKQDLERATGKSDKACTARAWIATSQVHIMQKRNDGRKVRV